MHIAASKKKTAPSDTPIKRGTQQKKYLLMPYENNCTLQKWHMTNSPPKIDQCDTHRKWCLTKMEHLVKKYPQAIYQWLS